ncbi:MAG: hypothetical protein JWO41_834 [Candidatus Saccharibacteria bacterium]|nr:hypothetical protein [Candidatus Saccharibacteria bacterium]
MLNIINYYLTSGDFPGMGRYTRDMNIPIPDRLHQLDVPPKQLFARGAPLESLLATPCVAIVGGRAVSPYGRQVTDILATQLAERGITIISGLAFGVDSIAHKAALRAGGKTIAVLPGSVDEIYPRWHANLAEEIIAKGGALVSECPLGTPIIAPSFIFRNRLIAGLADAVLLTEAALKSGSLHTAGFARDQGKDLLAVPGPVTSPTSIGTNNLIKTGAAVVTVVQDILQVLKLQDDDMPLITGDSTVEQQIIDLMRDGHSDGSALLKQSGLEVTAFNQALIMLEINGKVRALGNNMWSLCR